jgi:probable rRNA maturation factor
MKRLVDCVIEEARWEDLQLAMLAERAGHEVLAELALDPAHYEIALLAADDARIARLNAEFRGKAAPTNVLSWPSEDLAEDAPGADPARPLPGEAGEPWGLGDVALAYETCAREAEDQGKPLAHHVTHLVVHGILHLLGHDHVHEADAALMEGRERRILARLGIPDPY